ncbi:MAG: DUF935 family protein [Verrucomicrobiota bacterium]
MNPASTITPVDALLWRQSRFNPLRNLTAQSLTSLRDQFDAGTLRGFAILADQIAACDDTAGPVLDKRCSEVASRPWDVLIGEDVPESQKAEALAHQAALKSFYSNLRTRNAVELDEMGGLMLLIRQMMNAVYLHYAAHEVVWQPGAGFMSATLWNVPLAFLECTTGGLRYSGPLGATMPGSELPRPNWLFSVHASCLAKRMAVLYLLKKLSLSDWVNYSEVFGMPGIHMTTTAKPGSDEWLEAQSALEAFAQEWRLLTTEGQKVNLIEASGGTGDGPFAPMVDRCDRAMARVMLGSDLATLSREQGAGASLQGEDTDKLIAADCVWVSETLQEQLSTRVIEWQFGEGTRPLAFFKLSGPQRQDTKLEMEVDKHVASFGVKLSREDIAERYSRTHDETQATDPAADADAAAAAAANEEIVPQALRNLRDAQRRRLGRGLGKDLSPARDALLRIEHARTPDAMRQALGDLDPEAIEAEVLQGDATTQALEVILSAEFLAGLASLGDAPSTEAANANMYHDRLGRFTSAPSDSGSGLGAGSGGYQPPARPESPYGTDFVPNPLTETIRRQVSQETRAALDWVVANQKDAMHAIRRPDLGDISLVYGWADDPQSKKAGQGIAKIESKHASMLARLPEIIASGDLGPPYQQGGKRNIRLGDATVVLRLDRDGDSLTWVLNAFSQAEQTKGK